MLEIWHHIATDSPQNATRVADAIEAAVQMLREWPGLGHTRADVQKPDYRFWSVFSYVIAYRFDEQTLTVVRVVHGRRNFRKLFRR